MKKAVCIIFLFLTFNLIAQVSDFKKIDFTKANNIAKLNYGKSLNNLPLLSYQLTSTLKTDVEKFRAIYLWVCQNISVDVNQSDKVLSKRKKYKNDSISFGNWNTNYMQKTFKRLVKQKKTMCTGYAYLIKELCFFANIECEIINGYARSATTNIEQLDLANHSWNAVKLKGKWYLCDAIWASGYSANGIFIKDYNDGYFLSDPELFAMSHYPLQKKWLLVDSLIKSEFKVTPIIYGGAFKHKILPIYPINLITIVKKGEDINFRFKTLDKIRPKNINLVYAMGSRKIPLDIQHLNFKNGIVTFTTKLKFKGFYDVHLKINNSIVTTYSFKVIKKKNAQPTSVN